MNEVRLSLWHDILNILYFLFPIEMMKACSVKWKTKTGYGVQKLNMLIKSNIQTHAITGHKCARQCTEALSAGYTKKERADISYRVYNEELIMAGDLI